MAILSDYTVGTASVAANGTTVTGTGTAWQAAEFREGDWFLDGGGNAAIVASVDSNTSLTLTAPWKGPAITGGSYRLRYMSDGSRVSGQARQLINLLGGSGNLTALGGLAGVAGKVPVFTGPGTMALTDPGTPDPNGTLTALATIAGAANTMPYFTGAGAADRTNLTAFARTLLASTSATNARTALGAQYTLDLVNNIELGQGLSGDRLSFIDFHASDGLDYSARIIRAAGVNGNFNVQNAGTGIIQLIASGGVLASGTTRLSVGAISSNHAIEQTGGVGLQPQGAFTIYNATGTPVFIGKAAAGNQAVFYVNGTSVGIISSTVSSTNYGTTSDYRIKPYAEPLITFELDVDQFDSLDNSLLRIMATRPIRHNWINEPDTFTSGFLAHELQAIFPHAVIGEKDGSEDIGNAVIAGELMPSFTRLETREVDGQTVTEEVEYPEYNLPDQIVEGVTEAEYPNAKSWTKTGSRPVYQNVDHSKLVPELVAAVQALTLMVLEQGERILTLEAFNESEN